MLAGKAVGPVYTALAAADLRIAVAGCTEMCIRDRSSTRNGCTQKQPAGGTVMLSALAFCYLALPRDDELLSMLGGVAPDVYKRQADGLASQHSHLCGGSCLLYTSRCV